MPDLMLALGDYRFSVDSAAYDTFRRATDYRWAEMPRIGRLPAHQYVGPGGETIELIGTVYPTYKGGLGQIDAMKREAEKGQPLRLVSGIGDFLYRWVITSVEETKSYFMQAGIPRKIEFRLQMQRYGEDGNLGELLALGNFLDSMAPAGTAVTVPGLGSIALPAPAIQLADLSALSATYKQAGIAPQQALSTLNKAVTIMRNIDQQAAKYQDAFRRLNLTVEAVRTGFATDPSGTIQRILVASNSLGPERSKLLEALVGPDTAKDLGRLADAATIAQTAAGRVKISGIVP